MKKTLMLLLAVAALQCASAQEITVINGKIYKVSDIKNISVATKSPRGKLPELIKSDNTISIFADALYATHLSDSLLAYIDMNYSIGEDSISWNNDRLCFSTGLEFDNVAYMKNRFYKFTVFIEPDEILKDKYGITSLNDLIQYAKQVYDSEFPMDANITDPTDRRNSLNRFVSYHILPFQASYYQLTCVDGPNSTLAGLFNRRVQDISDWYETLMPHSLMKLSFPSGEMSGLYINRRGAMSGPDGYGIKIRGSQVTNPNEMPDNMAINGLYYYIDDIIAYDKITRKDVIGGERLRFDATTLSPDFLTSGARGHSTRSTIENGKYGVAGQGSKSAINSNTCMGFKGDFTKNFRFNDYQTHLHVTNRVLSAWSYEGDNVSIIGPYDVTVKLPSVPEGDWEIRLFSCYGANNRGIVQFYVGTEDNMQPCGMPVDMRTGGDNPSVGWKSDSSLGDVLAINYFDHNLRRNGWMKGPANYGSGAQGEIGGGMGTPFRNQNNTLRRIITQFHSDGKSDYYLRMKQMMDSPTTIMALDFIELCPSCIYDNEYFNEDKW